MTDLTAAYDNVAHVADAAEWPGRWAAMAAEFRQAMEVAGRARPGIGYGPEARQVLDLFLPGAAPLGLAVVIHGGYWRRFSGADFSHLAAGLVAAGWAVAVPSYRLVPQVRIAAITRDAAAAVERAAAEVPGVPIRLTGHSAGGHLVTRLGMADAPLSEDVRARIERIVPVSPVCDLRPLMQTDMNADLRLDADEAAAESPTLGAPLPGISGSVWVGAAELPAFVEQARAFGAAWGWPVHEAPGRHHFDVIGAMGDPVSDMVRDILL